MTIFRPDELVDIVLRGVRVDWQGDHALTVTVPGCAEPIDIPTIDDLGDRLRLVTITRTDIISVTPSPDFNLVSKEAKAAVLAWLNREARSFTGILAMAWCATVTETGGTPDEVELVDGSRLVYTHSTGWTAKPSRVLAATTIPAGPGIGCRNLHTAVTDAVLQGLPQPAGTGTSDELGRWIRLHTIDDARTWARALGLGGDTGAWGDGQVMLTLATADLVDGYRHLPGLLDDGADGADLDPETGPVDDPDDLSTLGQDYEPDPAKRIKQIAAIHPEFVALAVVAQRLWRDRDGSVWREGDNPRQMIFVSSSTPDDDLPAGRLTDRELLERHYGPLTEVVDQRPIRTEL